MSIGIPVKLYEIEPEVRMPTKTNHAIPFNGTHEFKTITNNLY